MKRTPEEEFDLEDDLKSDYRCDPSKAKPNRFAQRLMDNGEMMVVLESDITSVFKTPESVKDILRALIKAMPKAS
jgi:hypothetical protein